MTFEEFFIKKRIDLTLLQRAKPDLYEEFRVHYSQMGEKSFDHIKKYWFNRLRRDFQLEVVADAKLPDTADIVAEGGADKKKKEGQESGKGTKAGGLGFKPRFRAGVVSSGEKVNKPEITEQSPSEKEAGSKSASTTPEVQKYKPRFRAVSAVAKEKNRQEAAEEDSEKNEKVTNVSKPLGFKPRFKTTKTPGNNTGE